jgi:hypothetical protein
MGEKLRRALHRHGIVPGADQRRGEPITHERGVVGDNDGLVAHGSIAEFIRFSL